jgi:hypothetical protein
LENVQEEENEKPSDGGKMTEPIYELFLMKPTEAWYQLTKEEQDKLFAVERESSQKAGSENIMFADSTWSNQKWMFFGVKKYSNIEALQDHIKRLEESQWFRYVESKVILGTEWSGTD